tara:strand:- start:533 stop:721 length:189 start_codon:yes stop_codon:yes gene_type:complete
MVRACEALMLHMEKLHITDLVTAAHMEERMTKWNPPRPEHAVRMIPSGPWYSGDVVLDAWGI